MSNPDPRSLVQRLYPDEVAALRGFAMGMTGDAALADDAVQDAFVIVIERAADFQPGSDFRAWCRAIVRRKVLELLRFRGRACLLDGDLAESLADCAPSPERWEAERTALADCIRKLPQRARELTELRHLDGLSPPAIAERLRWTVNAVNVALSRVRQRLRDCIQQQLLGGSSR